MHHITIHSIQSSDKRGLEVNYAIIIASLLDANYTERKAFESLAIRVKNLQTQGETVKKNHEYETWDEKIF